MPFEPGNRAGHNSRVVDAAIRRVMARDSGARLIRAVDRVFDDAADGETFQQRHAALAWIADRTDGKAIARVEQSESDVRSLTLQDVARLIYQARAAAAEDATPAPSTSERTLSSPDEAK